MALVLLLVLLPLFLHFLLLRLLERPQYLRIKMTKNVNRLTSILPLVLDGVVMADAGAPAYLALALSAVMLAYLRSATLIALAFATLVGADADAHA